MLFTFLLVVQAVIAFALVAVILMQRSEGGGLGMGGGSTSGLMSARGAADFLTRATTLLATFFVLLSIVLAVLAATQHSGAVVDTSLVGQTVTTQSVPDAQDGADALAGAAATASGGAAQNQSVPLQ